MSNIKRAIEEYYTGSLVNLETAKLVGHEVVFYRKNDPTFYKEQWKVTDAFSYYIKVKDEHSSQWLNINTDIVLLFVIETVVPEIKMIADYNGSEVHNAQAEIARKIQEAFKKHEKEKNDHMKAFPFRPPVEIPRPHTLAGCSKCGLELSGVMCYSCPNSNCPCGMGPTWCQNPTSKGYETDQDYLERTDNILKFPSVSKENPCCSGNCGCNDANDYPMNDLH